MNKKKIKEQVLGIRKTGEANMFDILTVQRMALDLGYNELVDLMESDRKAYVHFILTGKIIE